MNCDRDNPQNKVSNPQPNDQPSGVCHCSTRSNHSEYIALIEMIGNGIRNLNLSWRICYPTEQSRLESKPQHTSLSQLMKYKLVDKC